MIKLIRDDGVLAYPWCKKGELGKSSVEVKHPAPCENPQRGAGMGTRAGRIAALLFSIAPRRTARPGGGGGGAGVAAQSSSNKSPRRRE